MKIKYLPLIAALFAVTPIVTSCLDNDEVVIDYGSETSITSFKLGTLHIDRIGKDKMGKIVHTLIRLTVQNTHLRSTSKRAPLKTKTLFPWEFT